MILPPVVSTSSTTVLSIAAGGFDKLNHRLSIVAGGFDKLNHRLSIVAGGFGKINFNETFPR
jgi:hypothetical protein